MASKSNKCSPEYVVLEQYLHNICDALSKVSGSITPLARDYCSAGIITSATMSSASPPHSPQSVLTPYERANAIMTAALVSVQQDPRKFGAVVEKLSDHGLNGLVKEMDDTLVQPQGTARSRSPPLLENHKPLCKKKFKIKRQRMKILVVGHNGSGKSSLINEMLGGRNVAVVGRPEDQTHTNNPVEKYELEIGDVDVTIYDARGLGDPSITDESTMNSIVKIKTVDIVLLCHKLYDRVDGASVKELKVLFGNMDDDLIDLSILVFTFGDEYQIRCDPVFDDKGKLTGESKQEVKEAMNIQKCQMEHKFKDTMKKNGTSDRIADRVPSCITCGKRKRNGERKELPTSDNWVDDLWELCEERCKREARPFVRSMKSKILETLGNAGSQLIGFFGKKK
ncbi:PREDICTED: uncharacterized protein LOC109585571 [Amphimedon queenslandica]|uniref:AIG1-type G domain-containing protein n=1 Tax=Amphimedon queenslandica TaxID=400682 RepID=A0A1X7TX15_AMPQE|nr:PREDICTED: uncharacterized protein LOC109585571 [Amphimedon queenslandica]|eukprot:XP_019857252.1 PREDICTED: uncharacterized protein LOC109585571 [Amphimedon queenslandica]